jgi:hypothetical protein
MDAIQFLKEKERMCKTCGSCLLCPAWLDNECIVNARSSFAPEQQINTVKVWTEQNPRKTRQSVFLEQYPNAIVNAKGTVEIWPCNVEKNMQNVTYCNSLSCEDCRRKFWMKEV